ncbi:MAG: hypothetical protein OXU20_00075 [Myxococcales bacterium]|nr:hypothetical protein [Myxococcales bacterium]
MSESPLKPIADGLWEANNDHIAAAGAIHFPLRMTVAQRPDGGLVLISPVPIGEPLAAALAQVGEVTDIVAPNGLHHLHAAAALDRYPSAQLWLAPCLADKRPELALRGKVLTDTPASWAPALSAHPVLGAPALTEVVVLHQPSRTLVTTDLVFHIHESRGWLMPLILRMSGGWKRLAQTRLMRSMLKDRAAARGSFEALLALDFDRLIMAHGEIVDRGGHSALAEALAWLVPPAVPRPVTT